MQCSSCKFENMPGVSNCGRCGAVLNLSAAPMDVEPPRARPWIKPFRRGIYFFTRRRRLPGNRTSDWDKIIHARFEKLYKDRIPWGLLIRMIVPGWPQFYLGRKLPGMIFLFGYLTCLPLGILFAGTGIGALLMGLAICFHASSIADIVIAHAGDRESRVMYSIGCLSLVGLALYFPAYQLISRVAIPLRFVMDSPPFQADDVIIYNPSVYRRVDPQVGDMVVFRLPNERINVPGRGHVVYDLRGQEVVGRLVAGPGQTMTFEKGALKVDGKLSPWSDLFNRRFQESYTISLSPGSYFILAAYAQGLPNNMPDYLWFRFSTVSRERIIGRVYFRTQPLTRFGYIR
jgi:hypothetical protein